MRTSIYVYTISAWLLAQKAKSRGGILVGRSGDELLNTVETIQSVYSHFGGQTQSTNK